jgi:tetratricopeptide (TPR) repeat protein
MRHDHPDPDLLLRLLAGEVEEEEATAVGLHLLTTCPRCLNAVTAALGVNGLKDVEALAGPGWALELAAERARARRLLAAVAGMPWEQRCDRLQAEEDFHRWGVAEALLEECSEAWADEPERGLRLANLAVEILDSLDDEEAQVADLQARAWAYVGNSLRVLSDLRGAERAFGLAEDRLPEGSGAEALRADVSRLRALLRADQRRYREADRLAGDAVRTYVRAGNRHLAARALLNHARILRQAGEVKRATAALERALFLIDRKKDGRLLFLAKWNRVQLLFESEQRDEARLLAVEVRAEAARCGQPLDVLRWHWYEGQMASEEGRDAEAEAVFREVRESFLERGIGYDAALASLDLALLYARQGKTAEVGALAREMLPIFQSRDDHREALAALVLLRRAAEVDLVTPHLLGEIRAYLEKARGRPELRFEAPAGLEIE